MRTNPDTLHTPVKDGACITPTVYNPETIKPIKKIVLEYSPERAQDGLVDGEYELKMEMKDLLDKVLDNPYDYQVKGERGVIVRGVFERNELVQELTPPRYLTGVKSFVKEGPKKKKKKNREEKKKYNFREKARRLK